MFQFTENEANKQGMTDVTRVNTQSSVRHFIFLHTLVHAYINVDLPVSLKIL